MAAVTAGHRDRRQTFGKRASRAGRRKSVGLNRPDRAVPRVRPQADGRRLPVRTTRYPRPIPLKPQPIMKNHTFPKLLLPLAAVSLCLSACGDKVLDWRNAEQNNGAIYAQGENTPFTGKVTNVPDAAVFNDPGFLAFSEAVGKAYGSAMQLANPRINLDQLLRQSAVLFMNTGLSFTNREDDAVVFCNIKVNGGKLTGKVSCTSAGSDNVVLEANMGSNAAFDGAVNAYVYDNGKQFPFVTATLKDGKLDGTESIYSPATHKVIFSVSFDSGVATGTEDFFDENTGNKLQEAVFVDGRLAGGFTRWAPGGNQVIDKGSYSNGSLDGLEEAFDPATGKKIGEAHWSNGKLNGENRRWDAQGNLIALRTYQNGFLATSSDPQDIQTAYGQDPNHPAVYVPLPGASGASAGPALDQGAQSADNQQLADQIHQVEQAGAASQPQPVPVAHTPVPQADSGAVDIRSLASDAPAAMRCGWIENSLPGGDLTLRDRDGTWAIRGGAVDGDPEGFDTKMPATDKGDSCGCLTVQTNRQHMQIIAILGGRIIPVARCQADRSLR